MGPNWFHGQEAKWEINGRRSQVMKNARDDRGRFHIKADAGKCWMRIG